jgi:hypothetical protein
MRAIRAVSVRQGNRAAQSKADHHRIIDALRRRDAVGAEAADRDHTLGLAAHVAEHGVFTQIELFGEGGLRLDHLSAAATEGSCPALSCARRVNGRWRLSQLPVQEVRRLTLDAG